MTPGRHGDLIYREEIMSDKPATDNFGYPGLEFVFASIARWINNYREAFSTAGQLAECAPEEVARISRDLMIRPTELAGLARKGPEAAKLLPKMLVALGVDPKNLEDNDPAVIRDLQRLCITCGYKRTCEHALSEGKAADDYHDFCPNAFTLEALFKANANPFFWQADDKREKA
jgi:Family of unknown function (DUF6455)